MLLPALREPTLPEEDVTVNPEIFDEVFQKDLIALIGFIRKTKLCLDEAVQDHYCGGEALLVKTAYFIMKGYLPKRIANVSEKRWVAYGHDLAIIDFNEEIRNITPYIIPARKISEWKNYAPPYLTMLWDYTHEKVGTIGFCQLCAGKVLYDITGEILDKGGPIELIQFKLYREYEALWNAISKSPWAIMEGVLYNREIGEWVRDIERMAEEMTRRGHSKKDASFSPCIPLYKKP